MEAIGKLDEHDADIVRHRDDHLAEILGLLFFAALERDLGDFRHPIDQFRNLGTELVAHLLELSGGVFHDVMQQRGHDRGDIQLELRRDRRDRQRMAHEGLAGQPLLLGMLEGCEVVRFADQGEIGLRIVSFNPLDQLVELVWRALG